MGKKLPHTPRSRIKAVLRLLSLRSRERASVIKRDSNTCQVCGKKGSKAKGKEVKVVVHHKDGINWEKIFKFIYQELLVNPKHMQCICKDCHKEKHSVDCHKKGHKNGNEI